MGIAGLKLKNRNFDAVQIIMAAMQLRLSSKHVVRDWKNQEKEETELTKLRQRHNIKDIGEDLKKENHSAEDAAFHSHRVVTLDLLLLYGIARFCKEFILLLQKEVGELRAVERNARSGLKVLLEKYELKFEEVKNKLSEIFSRIKTNLMKERKIIDAMEEISVGKTGVALTARELSTLKVGLIRYFRMRFPMVRARKAVTREKSDIEAMKQLLSLPYHFQALKAAYKGENTSGLKSELKKFDQKEGDFLKATEKGANAVYYLFINDFLILRMIIQHLYNEKQMDEKMASEHEIPLSMAQADEEEKARILREFGKRLQEERMDIKQIWTEITSLEFLEKQKVRPMIELVPAFERRLAA